MFVADKIRIIGLLYGEKTMTIIAVLIYYRNVTDGQTELLYQYRASVCWREIKIGYRHNFLNYLAFTYFILLWSEMTEMTHFPRHIASLEHSAEHHRQGRWSMESMTAYMHEDKGASFWTSAVNNRFFSEPPNHKSRLFSESLTVYRRKRVHVLSVW